MGTSIGVPLNHRKVFLSCYFKLSYFYLDLQILNNPQENLTINCRKPVTLSVSAVGSGQLSFQWKKDGKDITDPEYTGVKGPKLTIPSFWHKHQGNYICNIKNTKQSINSSPAKLKLSK